MSDLVRRDAIKMMAAGLVTGAAMNAEANEARGGHTYFVLACDGGGIRGYLTSLILAALEKECRRNGVELVSKVDLFAGTSTGSIIALGLARGLSAANVVSLFENDGPSIFGEAALTPKKDGVVGELMQLFHKEERNIVDRLGFTPGQLLHPKYHNRALTDVLTRALGANTTFGDLKRSALVTTFRLSCDAGWAPLVLHNLDRTQNLDPCAPPNHKKKTRVQDGPSLDLKLVEAALASSAAPLYFPPYNLPGCGYCVDGGLFANCPSAIAFALVNAFVPAKSRSTLRILSLGTGATIDSMHVPTKPFSNPEQYGAAAWLSPVPLGKQPDGSPVTPAFPLVSALFDASSASQNYICEAMPGIDYHRVQVNLTKALPLDDASTDGMSAIQAAASSWIKGPDFKDTLNWLGVKSSGA